MKTRHILLSVICIIAVAMGFLFAFALKKHNAGLARLQNILKISLTSIEGEEFLLSELHPERKTAILFFSPGCEFCKKEISGIITSRKHFKGIKWVFVTISPYDELEEFLLEYPLMAIEGAKVCIEENPQLHFALDVTAPPSLFIYDADGQIEHYSRGAVSIKTILEWLR